MKWKHSDTVALAKDACTTCDGSGFKPGSPEGTPCKCVYRQVFRACFARFEVCVRSSPSSNVTYERISRPANSRHVFGRKNEEFIADFWLIARRVIGGNEIERKILSWHFMLGADWKLCCRRLGMSRGNFFHAVYHIEEKLGKAFRETQPYGLFPLDEYFGGTDADHVTRATVTQMPRAYTPVRPPLRKAVA